MNTDDDLLAGADADLYDQFAGNFVHAQRAMVDEGLDHKADDAAEALTLGDLSGTPPEAILADPETFKDTQRRAVAQQIVLNNPDLVAYLQSHPLVSAVSNDDWANLDKFTRESSGGFFKSMLGTPVTVQAVENALGGAWEGIKEGLQSGLPPDEAVMRAMDPWQNKAGVLGALSAKLVYGGADATMRLFNAAGGAMGGGIAGFAQGIGLEETESRRVAEAFMNQGMAEAGMHVQPKAKAPNPLLAPEKHEAFIQPKTAMDMARPFLEAGQEPPTGLHTEIDAGKAQINSTMLDALEKDLQNLQASTTRERAPDLLKQGLLAGKYGDSAIGLHADAALALYGDKPPAIDDGLLGWVPGIESQLAEARETGADVSIPIKDWLAHVDPQVAKALHDDLRMWPLGITAREGKELPPPKEIIDEALPSLRASAGLEPKFSMGDRKLTLAQASIEAGDQFHPEVHSFNMLDENGQHVGDMEIIPGPDKKTLYVNWIGGQAGLWANSFGPGLIRDVKRQLKAQYPDYEYLTGHRVSGARERADDFGPMPLPRVRLDAGDTGLLEDHRKTTEIFQNGWVNYAGQDINLQRQGFYTPAEQKLYEATAAEVQKLTGGKAQVVPTAGLRDTASKQAFGGMYVPTREGNPLVMLNMLGPDVQGVARHESVHLLRGYNVLTEGEWGTLAKAAADEGWLERYGIHDRYAHLDDEAKTEEAVAEGFREWMAQAPEIRPKTGVGAVFQKILDFFENIKKRLGFGPEDDWQTVFQRIQSGEVGAREAGAPREAGAADIRPKMSVDDERQAIVEGITNLQAASVGLDAKTFPRLREAIRKQAEEDLRIAEARAVKEQTKRQSAEWKANATAMRSEVLAEIRQRPDIAADLFIGSGELQGQKLRQRYTLAEDSLTPEQKAMLPDHYVSKNGLDPDHVASLFGYGSGQEMVGKLAEIEAAKNASGKRMRTDDFVRQIVNSETDRRMELRYGNREANILSDAHDQALSDSSINVMHEELTAVAQASGVTAFDKTVMRDAAKKLIAETPLGKVNSARLFQEMGRHSRNAEKELLAGNFAEAAVHMQRQTLTAMVAQEAKAVEVEMAKFEKRAKRLQARVQESLPEEYTNWIHDILNRVGFPAKRGGADLRAAIDAQASGNTLEKFVADKNAWLQPVAVWDQLYDRGFRREYKALTVDEFRAVDGSVKSLMHNGREESVLRQGEEVKQFEEFRAEAIDALKQFPAKVDASGGEGPIGGSKISEVLRTTFARHLQFENLFGRWDKFDPHGVWTQYVYRDLVRGVNQSDAWKKEFAKKLGALKDDVDLRQGVENNLFKAPPEYGGHTITMNRGQLRAVMLNTGNVSNLRKLAKGWGITPEAAMSWVLSKADAKDWKFVQGVWDIFDEMKERSDVMYRSIAGVPAESIEPTPIMTKDGTFRGGYYPVIYHENYAKIPKLQEVGLTQDGWEGATTPAGYTKSRTEFYAPLSMNIDRMPNRLSQMIHDTALRPAVLNAAKVFRDPKIQAAMTTNYGREYTEMMIPWLRNIANAANSQQPFSAISEFFRQNMITALVGFNPGTVLKHGPTAVGLSIKEVGAAPFFNAVRTMFSIDEATGDSNWTFAKENSLELQRRERNWQETLYGATGELVPGSKFGAWRQKIMEWSSKPVALSDMISAVPTWLAQYDKSISEGATHGDAVDMADRAVRRAHGSTAVTNRPMIAHTANPWFTSVYNFFNDIMNRQIETLWKAGEMVGGAKEGDWDRAKKYIPAVVGGFVAYAIWPAIVEHMVAPQASEPGDSWAKKAAKGMAYTLGASWVGVRDITNAMLEGKEPDVGLLSSAGKAAVDAFRDLSKKEPFSPQHAEKMIRDSGALAGLLTGIPQQISREASFAYGLNKGIEHPQGPWGWLVGARYGTLRGHSQTLDQYMKGQYDRRR